MPGSVLPRFRLSPKLSRKMTAERTSKGVESLGEKIANSVSHGVGLMAAIAATPVLIVLSVQAGGATRVVASSIFGATAILLYLASTLYHALPEGKARRVFRLFDHSAIYLLIAGTYTPFTLLVIQGAVGWSLFGLVWALAGFGVLLELFSRLKTRTLPLILYISMGWLVLFSFKPLVQQIAPTGLVWLVAGGIAYTAGVAFYVRRSLPYGHMIWHLFVMLGTSCHYVAVMGYTI